MLTLTAEDHGILNRCTLFQGLDADLLIPQLMGSVSVYSAGQFLFQEGERIDRVAVLLTGTIHAAFYDRSGREFLYQKVQPASLVGGEVVCTPEKLSPYCMYTEKRVRIWSFPWAVLEDGSALSLELRYRLMQNLLAYVATKNMRKYYKIDTLSTKSARERILKYLSVAAVQAHSATFSIPMDRETMARYLNLNRSVLSHELKQMEEEGLLQFRKNNFTLSPEICPPGIS